MKKQVFGRQFKRDFNERKALFKSLLSSLVLKESIKTTEEKAKAIKGEAEKLVTKVKKKNTNINGLLSKYLTSDAIKRLVSDIAPRFSERNGGYTRIVRLGRRFSDGAKMAVIEWVEKGNSELKDQKENKKLAITEETEAISENMEKDSGETVVARKVSSSKKVKKEQKRA